MKSTNTIYIAGKVTGLPIEQVESKFYAAEQKVLNDPKLCPLVAVNPVSEIGAKNIVRKKEGLTEWTDETNRKEIMGYCLYLLSTCDALYLLPDWRESKGAMMERDFALRNNMPIIYP